MRETRTQRASIAALFTRLRTTYGAARCVLAAGTSFFSSLLGPYREEHSDRQGYEIARHAGHQTTEGVPPRNAENPLADYAADQEQTHRGEPGPRPNPRPMSEHDAEEDELHT